MASWKKVLTSDDVTNLNLSNTDLTMTDVDVRKFTIGTQNESSRILRFDAEYYSTATNYAILELHRDDFGFHKLYLGAINGTFVGRSDAAQGSKYQLPGSATCGAGDVIVGTGDETTAFRSIDDWLDPDFTGDAFSHTSDFEANGSEPRSDKVLIWDDDESRYEPCSLQELSKAIGRTYNFIFGRNPGVATSGNVTMRTMNGGENTGYVVPYESRITGISYGGRFYNTDGTGVVKVGLKINGNGTWNLNGQASSTYNGFTMLLNYGNGVKRGYVNFGTPLILPALTALDVFVSFTGDTGGDVDDQTVVVFLDHYDNHTLPLTV